MISIVKAKITDAKMFYDLRNTKQSRSLSINKNPILLKDHKIWFRKALKNKNYLLLKILFKKKIKCGYVRYENKNKKLFVSINIKKKYQNKQIGSKALLQSEKFLKNVESIFALVKLNNIISKKLFIKTGYQFLKKNGNILVMKKKLSGLKIIDEIEKIRGKNNKNWMDILRLAYKKSPKETKLLISQVYRDDAKISKLVKKLIN